MPSLQKGKVGRLGILKYRRKNFVISAFCLGLTTIAGLVACGGGPSSNPGPARSACRFQQSFLGAGGSNPGTHWGHRGGCARAEPINWLTLFTIRLSHKSRQSKAAIWSRTIKQLLWMATIFTWSRKVALILLGSGRGLGEWSRMRSQRLEQAEVETWTRYTGESGQAVRRYLDFSATDRVP